MPGPFQFRCLDCGATLSATVEHLCCGLCGGLFEIIYSQAPLATGPVVPLTRPDERLTLGEGGTPVIEMRRTAAELGLERLWAKCEHHSPTGSFKDRGSAILVSVALEHGVREFVEDSSGNAGASLAAYAAAAGIKAHIFAPTTASDGKLGQIEAYGATLHTVEGSRKATTAAALAFARENRLVYLSHSRSPFFTEGMKSFAYEVAESAASAADHVVFPVGNGSLLIGAGKGFDDLLAAGRLDIDPRLHCVQADAVRPIAAELTGEQWSPGNGIRTIASGISVSAPPRFREAVDAVRSSGGAGIAVDDASVVRWRRRIALTEGIFCELTSAAAFAGIEALMAQGVIEPGALVLAPVTGSGLKEPL